MHHKCTVVAGHKNVPITRMYVQSLYRLFLSYDLGPPPPVAAVESAAVVGVGVETV